MALRFCDSFDHYATVDLPSKGYSTLGNVSISTGNGRAGGNCLYTIDDSGGVKLPLTSKSTWIVGVAWYPASLNAGFPVRFYDGATLHVDLRWDGANTRTFYFTRNGTEIGTRSPSVGYNQWMYLEVKVVIADAPDGAAYLRVNGVEVIASTGLDTRNAANASADTIALQGIDGNGNAYFDDLYICDGDGSINNDFLGDIKVECLYPTADGATVAWTASSGSDYACVDEAQQNGDADYIASSTASQVDTFTMGNLTTTTGTIKGVQYLLMARKDDAGSRSVAPVVRPVSTDRVGTTAALGNTYAFVREIAELNPEDSAAWEIADINGLEYGVKLIA